MLLTYKARIVADAFTRAVLEDLLRSATKVYNGLLWHLRKEYKETGRTSISLSHLNSILKQLPRRQAMYADCANQICCEVQRAYKSFFALRKKGKTQHSAPGFRRKEALSTICYPRVNNPKAGVKIYRKRNKTYCEISLGTQRADGVRHLKFRLEHDPDMPMEGFRTFSITYDKISGQFQARLVIDVPEADPKGSGQAVGVDLGETWAIAAHFEDGSELLISGRKLKAIRRYWQKVRSKVKPPSKDNPKMSRRYRQIARKESRQIDHLLHIISKNFVKYCLQKNVKLIVIGEPKDIREHIDYGPRMNQRLHAWPWRKLDKYITYKAKRAGIQVEHVNEAYTSQTCPVSGHKTKANRPSRGQFKCKECGFSYQADLIGALNILRKVSPHARMGSGSSGRLARPAVLWLTPHMVCEPVSFTA